jgi:hypothetical protein
MHIHRRPLLGMSISKSAPPMASQISVDDGAAAAAAAAAGAATPAGVDDVTGTRDCGLLVDGLAVVETVCVPPSSTDGLKSRTCELSAALVKLAVAAPPVIGIS